MRVYACVCVCVCIQFAHQSSVQSSQSDATASKSNSHSVCNDSLDPKIFHDDAADDMDFENGSNALQSVMYEDFSYYTLPIFFSVSRTLKQKQTIFFNQLRKTKTKTKIN
jgi:hypothetical protein